MILKLYDLIRIVYFSLSKFGKKSKKIDLVFYDELDSVINQIDDQLDDSFLES